MSGREANLMQLLQPTIESMGFELWGIELVSPGKRPTLRIYIDADDGVTVDRLRSSESPSELGARR